MRKLRKTYFSISLLIIVFVVLAFVLYGIAQATYKLEYKQFQSKAISVVGRVFYSKPINDKQLQKFVNSISTQNHDFQSISIKNSLKVIFSNFEGIEKDIQTELFKEDIDIELNTSFFVTKFSFFDSLNDEKIVMETNDSLLLFGEKTNEGYNLQELSFYHKGNQFFIEILLKIEYPSLNKYILKESKGTIVLAVGLLGLVFFIVMFTIITLIRQKKLAEMKCDFIDHITHELNTPISTIQLAANTLKKDDNIWNNDEYSLFVEMIDKQNRKLSKTLSNVIDLNLINRTDIVVSPQKIDVSAIDEIVDNLKQKYSQKDITVEISKNPDADVFFDEFYFGIVIENLLENSIKYSLQKVDIEIYISILEGFTQISIKDNGIGIAKKNLRKVFARNFQINSVGKHGLGFGLYYVRKIVDAHKGKIFLKSVVNEGTEIIIKIPCKIES